MSDALNRTWGYCTDCEEHMPVQADGRGACGHGRVIIPTPDPLIAALVEAELLPLQDPMAVHLNMLAGKIAKPTVAGIIHIYGAEALRAALEAMGER